MTRSGSSASGWVSLSVAAMTVQPKGFVQSVYVSPDANCPDDSENYAPDRTGYDLAEVYALREYAPGDSLRQMHWKLSSKLDKLVVREPSLPVRRSVLVFWERTQTACAGAVRRAGRCCHYGLPVAAGIRRAVHRLLERRGRSSSA